MARKTRVEFAGAIYHVIDRGDRREAIYRDDADRMAFLETLTQACLRTGWRLHAYVLMSNHYHLMLETPEPNLVRGMHWFQATWTMRFNRRWRLRGHVLQGRYKAVVVDPDALNYFVTLSDYIHLNPVRAGIVGLNDRLFDYRWSSYPGYLVRKGRPDWLATEVVLGELGLAESASGRRRYGERMRQLAVEVSSRKARSPELAELRRGWCLGGEGFRERMLELMDQAGAAGSGRRRQDAAVRRDHGEAAAKRLLALGLEALGLRADELRQLPKGDERKAALAAALRTRTTVSNAWTAKLLSMGHESRVTHCLKMPANHPVRRKLETAFDRCANRPS